VQSHPFAAVFPLLDGAELEALAADIAAHGLHEPIWTFEGAILDGRNRLAACERANVTPTFRVFAGTRDEALDFAWSVNVARRHLNPGQKAAARVKFESEHEQIARRAAAEARRQEGRQKGGQHRHAGRASREAQAPKQRSSDDLAALVGVSHATIERAQQLHREAPALFEAVITGEKMLSQALREHRRATMRDRVPLPDGKFRVVYGDPPWHYDNSGFDHSAAAHYPTLTIPEICAIDVASVVADHAVLFLWVTTPMLEVCWPVITAWGFNYKTSIVWDKMAPTFGNYVGVQHEHLLIATRGSCLPDHPTPMVASVVSLKRSGVHSEKPEAFRQMIDRLYDGGADQKLELFARRAVPGWTAWGNEPLAAMGYAATLCGDPAEIG
jgi:N6-adenosine-specific RNA methylase IME4